MSSPKEYCICRSSEDSTFMICCENCEEWFHGKCINITKKQSKSIKDYYCNNCISQNPSLKIKYQPGLEPKLSEKKPTTTKSSHQEERHQEKKVERKQLTSQQQLQQRNQQPTINHVSSKQPKPTTGSGRRKKASKVKSMNGTRKQCGNPDCLFEARNESNYCSDECGLAFNKLRYETFFLPKYKQLENKPSNARLNRLKDWAALGKERETVIERINNLKLEKEELERTIQQMKDEAKRQCDSAPKRQTKVNDDNDDDDMDIEESEEVFSGDAAKTFCITCGSTFSFGQALKHWSSCHRKHEDIYNYTADIPYKYEYKETQDPNPQLYCNHQDKKTKRYCMNIASACPLHSNWNCAKDEVCGCPLNIMQKLVPDGNYCIEFKKDCTHHYHWDRFRKAQLDLQRVQAFSRLDVINERLKYLETVIEDSYGGVVGIMLHDTTDHEVDVC